MPDQATLSFNAHARLEDARVLFAQGRYHGAAYICGYAVEFALKARICQTLNEDPYPENEGNFKIHDLPRLLVLAGRRKTVIGDPNHAKIWSSVVSSWTPEMRYQSSNNFTAADAKKIIEAVAALLPLL